MAKYLLKASYTAEGAKGLLKDGGSKRRTVAEQSVKSIGGTIEAFYFAFGGPDAYLIVDVPDHASMAALSLTVSASGAIEVETVALISPEEIDQATKKTVKFRAPGR